MRIKRQKVRNKGEEDPLPRGRIADVEARLVQGEEQEAVAGSPDLETRVAKRCDGAELRGGGGPEVEGEEILAAVHAGCDGEAQLVAVVREEEVAGGGEAAEGAADGTAAEEGLRRQEDEDLPHDDLLWEEGAARRGRSSRSLRHGRRPAAWFLFFFCFCFFQLVVLGFVRTRNGKS